jgi:FtsP/CotA-like multicopper oxidase with cupredoxin domain
MFEEEVKDQPNEENRSKSSNHRALSDGTRRAFLQQSMMAASGLAIASLLPPVVVRMWAGGLQTELCPVGEPLQDIMEIKSSGNTLQAILKVLSEKDRTYPTSSGGTGHGPMRYLSGFDPQNSSKVWPTKMGVPSPGPTLRARVGDRVQITLLNHVNIDDFPAGGLDVAEEGKNGGCDKAVVPIVNINTYPGNPSFEKQPNCFHGSSSTNLHFHGSHVSPSGISDNVLLNIRPSPRDQNGKPTVNEDTVREIFKRIFANCAHGKQPLTWAEWDQEWRTWQEKLLKTYDATAPWQGGHGLPPSEQLWLQNQQAIAAKLLPQYYIGAFPNCFTIPTWTPTEPNAKNRMGQAPGTHWYHAHKHGSTALNLLNGMAGALIIEGDYDDQLNKFIKKQRVLVLQQYGDTLNLLKAPITLASPTPIPNTKLSPEPVVVNGQLTPCVHMNPNEMQLWRIVNACHQAQVPLDAPKGIKWVQTAQDGVQFNGNNYKPDVTNASFPVPARSVAPFGSLAAGNRIDLLVQAPSSNGTFPVTFGSTPNRPGTLLFSVRVAQDPAVPAIPSPMPFPTAPTPAGPGQPAKPGQFPIQPGFLADLSFGDVKVRRALHFKTVPDASVASAPTMTRGTNAPYPPPIHTIDGKQFSEHEVDQTMQLGATEEWTLYNDSTGPAHPFHIHINPFQVVEILNPSVSKNPVKLPRPWVWWDNFAIPPAAVPPDSTDGKLVSGYFKMLTRFVDFTGMYVLHCHILGHEDRGMMQLVQVCTDTTKCPKTTTMVHH